MDYEGIIRSVVNKIDKTFKNNANRICSYDKELIDEARITLNEFLLLIRKRIPKFSKMIFDRQMKYPTIIKVEKGNFIFKLALSPNGQADFEIFTIKSIKQNFDLNIPIRKYFNKSGYVYFIWSQYGYKIGCTKNISERVKAFVVSLPFEIKLHSYINCEKFNAIEVFLHELLAEKRINGEWFNLTEEDFIDIDTILKNRNLNRIIQ